jgi:hypothetical protein
MEGSGSEARSEFVQIIEDSDPGREAQKLTDPTGLDPENNDTASLHFFEFTFISQILNDKWLALGNLANQPPVAPSFDLVLHRAEKIGIFINYLLQ